MDTSQNRPGRVNATLVVGIVILAVGAWALIARIFHIRIGDDWWPLIFLVPGLAFLALAFSGRRANPGLAIAGAIVGTLGGIFLFQTATNNWESWAYIWALFPLASGLALLAAGNRNGDEAMARSGMETARWAGVTFVVLLIFFQVFIYSGLFGYLIPVVLIAIGGYMIWQQSQRGREAPMPFNPFGPSPSAAPPPPPPPPAPPPSPSSPRPWEAPAAAMPPAPTAPPVPPAAAAPLVIVTPPPVIVTPPPPRPVLDAVPEPFPADDLPPDPSVPVPTAPFPVDEGSEQIAEAAKKRTRTPRPRPPKPS